MKKSFIVIGLGRFGANVAKSLAQMNMDVLAVDIDEDAVTAISKDVPHCLIADSTKESVLRDLGARDVDHAVVAIGNNLEASILTVINLKNIGVKNITVRCDLEAHKELYKLIGATDVINPEESSAILLSNQINSDSILDYYPITKDYIMVKISVSVDFGGKKLSELDLRNNFGVNIVGIDRQGKFFIPLANDEIKVDDIVVVVGASKNVHKFDYFLNN